MDYTKYFDAAGKEAEQDYRNYAGYPNVDASFDDYVEAAGGSYMNQTGAMGAGGAGAPTSQPYIITLSNSTTNAVTSNIIGKAFANITAARITVVTLALPTRWAYQVQPTSSSFTNN